MTKTTVRRLRELLKPTYTHSHFWDNMWPAIDDRCSIALRAMLALALRSNRAKDALVDNCILQIREIR